jgi:drug/metabolite transporter (DMT)-like permease
VRDDQIRRGIALALVTAAISGISVYLAKFGTQAVPDPLVYTAARNLVVGLTLSIGLTVLPGVRGPLPGSRATWIRLVLIAVVGGSLPFLLFFWGISLTNAPLASLIQKSQFIWVALLAGPVLGEKSTRLYVLALGALLVGILLQAPVGMTTPTLSLGSALLFLASLLWSVETLLVRRVLEDVRPGLAATARMAGGAVVLMGFLGASGRLRAMLSLSDVQLLWVVLPSVLLLGYVVTWYSALRDAPAVVVTSLLALGAPITALLAGSPQLPGLSLTMLGTVLTVASGALLSQPLWRSRRTLEQPAGWSH